MDDVPCQHENLFQFSTIYGRTDWTAQPDGTYTTETATCDKVLEEETTGWECADCGKPVSLGENQRLDEEDDRVEAV